MYKCVAKTIHLRPWLHFGASLFLWKSFSWKISFSIAPLNKTERKKNWCGTWLNRQKLVLCTPTEHAPLPACETMRSANAAMTPFDFWETWDLSKTITLWFCPRQPAICSRLSLHREKPLNTTEIPLVYIEKRTKAQRKKEREMCVLLFVQSYGPSPWSGLIEQLCTGQNLGLNPPSPSNKPKSSSRISASFCVPSRCCGNVLLLLLSLYWSECNCSKTRLFRGASSFHAVWGVVGFLNNSKPQATVEVFPRDIKLPDRHSARHGLLERAQWFPHGVYELIYPARVGHRTRAVVPTKKNTFPAWWLQFLCCHRQDTRRRCLQITASEELKHLQTLHNERERERESCISWVTFRQTQNTSLLK